MDDTDFSAYPKSITELKADKQPESHVWKPRDALVSFLRRLDSGEFPGIDVLVIIAIDHDGKGGSQTHYNVSSPNIVQTLGALEIARMKIHMDAANDS